MSSLIIVLSLCTCASDVSKSKLPTSATNPVMVKSDSAVHFMLDTIAEEESIQKLELSDANHRQQGNAPKAKTDKSSTDDTIAVDKQSVSNASSVNYNLNRYNKALILASDLIEISALTYDYSSNNLLAVNDEIARIFYIDKSTGEIKNKWNFGKAGDYEGIEKVDNDIYVLKSNGHLYKIRNKEKAQSIKTGLSHINDVEGLAYHKKTNALLLACKGSPNIDKHSKYKHSKNIFSFNLATHELEKQPFVSISDKQLEAHYRTVWMRNKRLTEKASKVFLSRLKSFAPSAIAVNEKSGELYILSSVGKTMVVINGSKKMKELHFLDENVHRQPEGIAFDDQNSLYISNEGKGLVPKIFKFDPF